jgi:hypothetical protein
MPYIEDLSEYRYVGPDSGRAGTKAVGWLALGHVFPTSPPTEETLDLLWVFSEISVAQTRGGHDCEFCPVGSAYQQERKGEKRLLSTAEIRVFSNDGRVYAAPNLIYHYVAVHSYKPPDEFLRALHEGLRPPSREYFDRLDRDGIAWSTTSTGEGRRRPFQRPDRLGLQDER